MFILSEELGGVVPPLGRRGRTSEDIFILSEELGGPPRTSEDIFILLSDLGPPRRTALPDHDRGRASRTSSSNQTAHSRQTATRNEYGVTVLAAGRSEHRHAILVSELLESFRVLFEFFHALLVIQKMRRQIP